MLSILKYLLERSIQPSIDLELRRLYFPLDSDVSIVIEFQKEIRNNKEAILVNITENDLTNVINSNIQEISVVSTEYIGNREDIIEYNSPESQCLKLFKFLIELKSLDSKIINHYCIIDDYQYDTCYGFGCPDEPNYGFIVYINKEFWVKKQVFEFILNSKFNSNKPSLFLWHSYKNYNNPIPDSLIVNILITNTKTRRLGYFSLLSKYFNKYQKSSALFLNKKFESFCSEYKTSLKTYKNDKGEIKVTRTGNSAGHYIDLAKELGLLNLLNRTYLPGKSFKVFLVLKRLHKENNNIFELSKLDKLFFLEIILSEDYLYTSWLLELIFLNEKTSYHELNSQFQAFSIDRITELENKLLVKNNLRLRRDLAKTKERINKWEKPEIYLEHVLMPRINWLYDLELIQLDNRLKIELTNNGKRLFYNLCYLTDIKTDRFINFQAMLKAFYIHIFDDIYYSNKKNDQSGELINIKIKEYIIESFEYFKTLAPNRVTASQAILFTKYKLYLSNNIKVEYSYIRKILENNTFEDFIFKFQNKYGDGYIQIK